MTTGEVRAKYLETFDDGSRGVRPAGLVFRMSELGRETPFCCAVSLIISEATAEKDRRIAELEAIVKGAIPYVTRAIATSSMSTNPATCRQTAAQGFAAKCCRAIGKNLFNLAAAEDDHEPT